MKIQSKSTFDSSNGRDHNFIIFLFLRGPKSIDRSPQSVKQKLNYELVYLLMKWNGLASTHVDLVKAPSSPSQKL